MENGLSRRSVLSGLGAVATASLLPLHSATGSSHPDVIIIGAGIAGITAARQLSQAGISFTVVEARNRTGGRAFTESETFGVPYDHGCAWLHSADKNPLTPLIKDAGFDTFNEGSSGKAWMYSDGRELNDKQYGKAAKAIQRLESRVDDHDIEDFGDKSARAISKPKNKWDRLAHLVMGEYEAGISTDKLSAQDYQSQIETGQEWMVPKGMAAGIFTALGPVPVSLDTKVKKIRWGGKTVTVETDKGDLIAKTVIITVPTNIIADGTIAFEPKLPKRKMRAFRDCPMGVLDKVALQFDDKFNDLLTEAHTNTAYIEHYGIWQDHLLRPFDLPLDIAFTGGQQSLDLARQRDPQTAAVEFAMGGLVNAFGSDVRTMFIKGHFTNWSADPLARGAYSYSKPGRHKARKRIAKPVKGKLFFAGEACVPKWATQAAGAYISGRKAAQDAAKSVG